MYSNAGRGAKSIFRIGRVPDGQFKLTGREKIRSLEMIDKSVGLISYTDTL